MNNEKKDDLNIYKWFSMISITLIPLTAGIGWVFDINQNSKQIFIMIIGFLSISWINWSKYKENLSLKGDR